MIIGSVAYNDNYAHKRTDGELQDGVTYFSTKNTGLSKDIIVDTGENYKYYNHPLCLYVVNDDKETVSPVIVSNMPKSSTGEEIPADIIVFIQRSIRQLFDAANVDIDGFDFIDYIIEYRNHMA